MGYLGAEEEPPKEAAGTMIAYAHRRISYVPDIDWPSFVMDRPRPGTAVAAGAPVCTIGASGVVFGYATYLFVRGLFNRNLVELLVGIVVGVVWGGALLASVVPHSGVSWQAHVCGAIGGVVAAGVMARERPARGKRAEGRSEGLPAALS